MNKKHAEEALERYFASISREQFIEDLRSSGFPLYEVVSESTLTITTNYTIHSGYVVIGDMYCYEEYDLGDVA